jgi:hypothetical protein
MIAEAIVLLSAIYAAIGLVFAVTFVTIGMGRLDESAHGATLGVRLILIPGSAALWPILLRKWMRGGE